MTQEYSVLWRIDIDANSPREAAEKALVIQRNPLSLATFFEVTDRDDVTHNVELADTVADEVFDDAMAQLRELCEQGEAGTIFDFLTTEQILNLAHDWKAGKE